VRHWIALRALDPRAGLAIEPVRPFLDNRFQPHGQAQQRLAQVFQRFERFGGGFQHRPVELRGFGFQAIARLGPAAFVARQHGGAHGGEQALHRPIGRAFADARQPAIGGQEFGRFARLGDRGGALVVIAGDIRQPRRKPAPPPARLAFRADHPAAQLDRLGPGQRRAERAVGRVEHMVPFVEHDARGALRRIAPARGVDHDQRVVGDHQLGLGTGASGPLDEAFAIMRAAGIDAFAALVGQRGNAALAEQRAQPAGQIAADHVAILAIGGPARHQVRQDRRAPGKAALQRVFQIEQAQVILAPLAHHHRRRRLAARRRLGKGARAFAAQLALQRLGIGGNPDRAARTLGPQRGGAR
jgi:hypothetical protein